MKPRTTTTLLTLLPLLAACGLASAQPKPNQGARTASAILKITCDPSVLPLSHDLVETLLHTSGVAGEAAKEALGLHGDPLDVYDSLRFVRLDVPATANVPTRSRGGAGGRRGGTAMGGRPGMGMGGGGMMGRSMGGRPPLSARRRAASSRS